MCSGETLSASLVTEFFSYFNEEEKTIANFYGSTEVMGDVTFYLIKRNDTFLKKNIVPIGMCKNIIFSFFVVNFVYNILLG